MDRISVIFERMVVSRFPGVYLPGVMFCDHEDVGNNVFDLLIAGGRRWRKLSTVCSSCCV